MADEKIVVSFGNEFESDIMCLLKGRKWRYMWASRNDIDEEYWAIESWGKQPEDLTCGFEVSTPVCTTPERYIRTNKVQWRYFIDKQKFKDSLGERVFVPIFMGMTPAQPNQGNHIHVGLPNRHLTVDEVRWIASHIYPIMPLIIGMTANSVTRRVMSKRLSRGNHVFVDETYYTTDHYGEINHADEGTVEVRVPDACPPQVMLPVIMILRQIAVRALTVRSMYENAWREDDYDAWEEYKRKRNLAIERGLHGVDMMEMVAHLMTMGVDFEFPKKIPCIREYLYMCFRVRKCHGELLYEILRKLADDDNGWTSFEQEMNEKQMEFLFWLHMYMCLHPEDYFDNFLRVKTLPVEFREMIERWKKESRRFSRFSELIEYPIPRFKEDGRIKWAEVYKFVLPLIRGGMRPTYVADYLVRGGISEHVAPKIVTYIRKFLAMDDPSELLELMRRDPNAKRFIRRELVEMLRPEWLVYTDPEYFRKVVDEGEYRIARIREVEGMPYSDVAIWIAGRLMRSGMNANITPEHVINTRERFYVMYIRHGKLSLPVGCVAIDMPTGEIMHLYVEPAMRRRGIGKRLVKHVIDVYKNEWSHFRGRGAPPYVWARIRKNNFVSAAVFKSLGFEVMKVGREVVNVYKVLFPDAMWSSQPATTSPRVRNPGTLGRVYRATTETDSIPEDEIHSLFQALRNTSAASREIKGIGELVYPEQRTMPVASMYISRSIFEPFMDTLGRGYLGTCEAGIVADHHVNIDVMGCYTPPFMIITTAEEMNSPYFRRLCNANARIVTRMETGEQFTYYGDLYEVGGWKFLFIPLEDWYLIPVDPAMFMVSGLWILPREFLIIIRRYCDVDEGYIRLPNGVQFGIVANDVSGLYLEVTPRDLRVMPISVEVLTREDFRRLCEHLGYSEEIIDFPSGKLLPIVRNNRIAIYAVRLLFENVVLLLRIL